MAGNMTTPLTGVPLDITGEDFASLTFQVRNASARFMATSDTNPPDPTHGITYAPTKGETGAADLTKIFPGVDPIQRIWAWNEDGEIQAVLFRSWS